MCWHWVIILFIVGLLFLFGLLVFSVFLLSTINWFFVIIFCSNCLFKVSFCDSESSSFWIWLSYFEQINTFPSQITMFKLLAILFIIKWFARTNIFNHVKRSYLHQMRTHWVIIGKIKQWSFYNAHYYVKLYKIWCILATRFLLNL